MWLHATASTQAVKARAMQPRGDTAQIDELASSQGRPGPPLPASVEISKQLARVATCWQAARLSALSHASPQGGMAMVVNATAPRAYAIRLEVRRYGTRTACLWSVWNRPAIELPGRPGNAFNHAGKSLASPPSHMHLHRHGRCACQAGSVA